VGATTAANSTALAKIMVGWLCAVLKYDRANMIISPAAKAMSPTRTIMLAPDGAGFDFISDCPMGDSLCAPFYRMRGVNQRALHVTQYYYYR
jgi:hypothetical protein